MGEARESEVPTGHADGDVAKLCRNCKSQTAVRGDVEDKNLDYKVLLSPWVHRISTDLAPSLTLSGR